MNQPPNMILSHFELYVHDVAPMEAFYTRHLGFMVTDRGSGPDALVFLSRNPHEHHQLVLNPRPSRHPRESPVDHISFRVATLEDLRAVHAALMTCAEAAVNAVSHGTTWSLYFRDPEENRLEVFVDTPWHVAQPCRFPVDLSLSDEALLVWTEEQIRKLPGFCNVDEWRSDHAQRLRE